MSTRPFYLYFLRAHDTRIREKKLIYILSKGVVHVTLQSLNQNVALRARQANTYERVEKAITLHYLAIVCKQSTAGWALLIYLIITMCKDPPRLPRLDPRDFLHLVFETATAIYVIKKNLGTFFEFIQFLTVKK